MRICMFSYRVKGGEKREREREKNLQNAELRKEKGN